MQEFEWNERYSVGFPEMDEQHKRLIGLINMIGGKADVGNTFETIMGMFDYASLHFREEENLLRRNGYADLATQEREHKAFLGKAADFAKKDFRDVATAEEIARFLRAWLLHHILEEDKKYSRGVVK